MEDIHRRWDASSLGTEAFPHVDNLFTGAVVGGRQFDISPVDGRFLITKPLALEPGDYNNAIMVVLNWFDELGQRLGSN